MTLQCPGVGGRGRSPLIRLRRLHTSGFPTSVPERLELYGEARPKPPTLRRRAPKNTKNPSGGWGKAFWTESGSLISVSKSILPPPPVWRVPKIEKKGRFDTFFGRFLVSRNEQNAVNYSIFAF